MKNTDIFAKNLPDYVKYEAGEKYFLEICKALDESNAHQAYDLIFVDPKNGRQKMFDFYDQVDFFIFKKLENEINSLNEDSKIIELINNINSNIKKVKISSHFIQEPKTFKDALKKIYEEQSPYITRFIWDALYRGLNSSETEDFKEYKKIPFLLDLNITNIFKVVDQDPNGHLKGDFLKIEHYFKVLFDDELVENYINSVKLQRENSKLKNELTKSQQINIAKDFHPIWNGKEDKKLNNFNFNKSQYWKDWSILQQLKQSFSWKKSLFLIPLLLIPNGIIFIINVLKSVLNYIGAIGTDFFNIFIEFFHRGAKGRDMLFQVLLMIYWISWLSVLFYTFKQNLLLSEINIDSFLSWFLPRLPFTILFWAGLVFLTARQKEAHNEYLYFAHLEKMLNGMITYANSNDANLTVKEEYIRAGMTQLTKSPLEELARRGKSDFVKDLAKRVNINLTNKNN